MFPRDPPSIRDDDITLVRVGLFVDLGCLRFGLGNFRSFVLIPCLRRLFRVVLCLGQVGVQIGFQQRVRFAADLTRERRIRVVGGGGFGWLFDLDRRLRWDPSRFLFVDLLWLDVRLAWMILDLVGH